MEEAAAVIEQENRLRLKAEWVARDLALHRKWLLQKKRKEEQVVGLCYNLI